MTALRVITLPLAQGQRLYRQVLDCQDLGFEAAGELVSAETMFHAAAALDDRETALEFQAYDLLCGDCRRSALPLLLEAQDLDGRERLSWQRGAVHVKLAADFVRAFNGLVDAVRDWLRGFVPGRIAA